MRGFMKRLGVSLQIGLVVATFLTLVSSGTLPTVEAAYGYNDPAFKQRWERLDFPVQRSDVTPPNRGFTWGPPLVGSGRITSESYDGQPRTVEYFEKARMEINPQVTDPTNPWHVTTGLLVEEMVLGKIQTGANSFTTTAPNQAVVAGDPANPLSPSYASFQNLLAATSSQTGQTINRQLDSNGQVSLFQPPENHLFKNFDTVTGHNIADVFEDFFQQSGPVFNGSYIFAEEKLFQPDPLYIFGHPITEPYWTQAIVAGKEQAVLVQLFERRVLTYTPANPPANRVEMGNVGQHYFTWRYPPLTDEMCRQGMPQPGTPVSPALFPQDFSQFAASYLKSGPVPEGGSGHIFKYTTGIDYPGGPIAITQDGNLAVFGAKGQGVIALRLTDDPNQTCEAWRYNPPGSAFPGYNEPLLYNGLAILSDATGTLHAIHLADGTPAWTHKLPHQVYAVGTPITDGENLYFTGVTDEVVSPMYGPTSGHLYAVRLSDGGLAWQSPDIEGARGKVIFGFDGNIFFSGFDVAIFAYTRDGQPMPGWPNPSAGFIASGPSTLFNFSFANDRLYIGSGFLYALDRNGQVVDTYRPNSNSFGNTSMSLPTIVGDTVYVGVEDYFEDKTPDGLPIYRPQVSVHALNATNFKAEKFTFHTDFPQGTDLTVLDGYVYFGAAERLFQVRADGSGFNRQMLLAGDNISSTPVVRNGRVYVLSNDGNFYIVW
jgi:outer membrane protein assembly factor BamB